MGYTKNKSAHTGSKNHHKQSHQPGQPRDLPLNNPGAKRAARLNKVLLRTMVPNAGFCWASPLLITNRNSRDALIADGLRDNGRLNKKAVQEKLIAVVGRAIYQNTNRYWCKKPVLSSIYRLAGATSWVNWETKVAFVVFFRAVIDARVNMLWKPKEMEYNKAKGIKPCDLAVKIDELLATFGGPQGWVDHMEIHYDLWQDILEDADDVFHLIDGDNELLGEAPVDAWATKLPEDEDESDKEVEGLTEKMEGLEV